MCRNGPSSVNSAIAPVRASIWAAGQAEIEAAQPDVLVAGALHVDAERHVEERRHAAVTSTRPCQGA
jgi:hypothetical protein